MLNENNFTYVPKDIGKLQKSPYINAWRNNLAQVPDGIEELVLLQNLQLSNNVITDVNWQLARLANLRICARMGTEYDLCLRIKSFN